MEILKVLLIVFYVLLVICNYNSYRNNKASNLLTIITVVFATAMLFSTNTADLDWEVTELDMSGYRTIYEKYAAIEYPEFNMYYAFYGCMHIGQMLGLNFRTWWAIMSIMAMAVAFIACRIHKYNFNLFLATFMAYYEMVFYSGFKFFYGMCFLLLAYGYLLRNTKKDKILYALFVCLAGGFHTLYYFFLIFLIKSNKHPKYFIGIVVAFTVLFTVLMRISGAAAAMIAPFFNALGNDHVNIYTNRIVNMGFYMAVFLQLTFVYIASKIKKYKEYVDEYNSIVESFYYSVLLSIVFCPFYAVALTFMRFLTTFSLVAITASSSLLSETNESRTTCLKMSLLMVAAYWCVQLFGFGNFIRLSVIPFFDVL